MGKQSLVWAEGRAAQLVWKDAAAVKTHATGRVVAVVVVVIGAAVVIAVAASTAAAGPSSPVAAAVAAISVGVA